MVRYLSYELIKLGNVVHLNREEIDFILIHLTFDIGSLIYGCFIFNLDLIFH